MPFTISLQPDEWDRFSVPHSLRLIGEQQHLLGAGSISLATNLKARAVVHEATGPFALHLGGGGRDETGMLLPSGPEVAELAVRWEEAMRRTFVDGDADLAGLNVEIDFGPLWEVCPASVLGASPAVAVLLSVAALAHRSDAGALSDLELTDAACRLHYAATGAGPEGVSPFRGDMLVCVAGGVSYVDADGDRLNVQPLLPPESLLLVLAPDGRPTPDRWERERAVLRALQAVRQEGADVAQPGEEGLAALFAVGERVLGQDELSMLYGLMRVRELTEAFIEFLGEQTVDNDRLAEVCDEESSILADYFGFPAGPYDAVREAAAVAGALGAKLTYAFGGCPAAVVVAPGRRDEVGEALARSVQGLKCLLVDVSPDGLLQGIDDPDAL